MTTFEGSFLGDASRLPPDARLECNICWHVYDPAWQILPGTAFADLPPHWHYPNCDGAREQSWFWMTDVDLSNPSARLEATLRHIAETRMVGMAMVNPILAVEAVGFRPMGQEWVGVLITPWSMNLISLPAAVTHWEKASSGTKREMPPPLGHL